MTEYRERVDMQKKILLAEEYRQSPKWIHAHSLDSMWYETEESKEDLKDGNVTDIQFNSGRIERKKDGKLIRTFGKDLRGDELIAAYVRGGI